MNARRSIARRGVVALIALAALLPVLTTSAPAAAFGPTGLAEEAAILSRALVGQREEQERSAGPRIRLVDVEDGDKQPQLAIYVLGRSAEVLHTAKVEEGGRFKLPEKVLDEAELVAIGPLSEDFASLDRAQLTQFRAAQFADLVAKRAEIPIARAEWLRWNIFFRCASGSVRHCYPWPWLIADLRLLARPLDVSPIERARILTPRAGLAPANPDLQIQPLRPARLPYRCEDVCDGLVEVYRRQCCCRPFIIFDPRIPEIITELEDLVPELPPFPPAPLPDPAPFSERGFLEGGGLNMRALNAPRDLQAIRGLRGQALVDYIQARPYLYCFCGPATKVAEGFIRPDATFTICWLEAFRLSPIYCHDEYAFVVKQVINGSTVTIYNGPAAHQWFDRGEEADLVSYHPSAIGCRTNDFPGTGAFALLQDLGDTESHRLATPDATGWDRVAAPDYNDGLMDPAASPADALGKLLDRNWGGTIQLRYHFSEGMRAAGAQYYRVSVARADALGNPTGPRTYLNGGLSWRRYIVVGGNINVENENLGPTTVGGTPDLYRIPYDADPGTWQSGQYHGALATTRPEFTNGRYLLTLDVFNAAGQPLKPAAAPAGDPGTAAPFTFRRWFQPVGPTAAVPFGALTHMLWWDNRSAQAQIVDLRVDGLANTEECQFLDASAMSQFSSGYRAYHPEPMFQLYHRMQWRRGLGGPTGILTVPPLNPNNVGQFGPPGVSGSDTFADMLGPHTACSFSLALYTWVKTTDGQGRLSGLDASDIAAFALSVEQGAASLSP